MNNKIQNFLKAWWAGLSAPWRTSTPRLALVKIDPLNGALIWNKDDSEAVYLEVPDSLILGSAIAHKDQHQDPEQLISHALPFNAEELYVTINAEKLQAVLRSDIAPFLDQIGPRGQKIIGLVFAGENHQATIQLCAEEQNTSLANRINLASLVFLGLIVGCYFWVTQNNQQEIESLKSTLTQLNTNLNTALGNTPLSAELYAELGGKSGAESMLSLKGAHLDHVIKSLSALNEALANDTKVDQLSLQSTSDGLNLVFDAQSKSAAEQLSRFDQNPHFKNPDFISAISSNTDNSIERFRLISSFRAKQDVTRGLR